MELLIKGVLIAIIYIFNLFAGYVLAWIFTEKRRPLIDVKPFNCRGCLSFWITLFFGLIWAAVFGYLWLILISVITGLINFFYIKSKFKIYE